MNAASPFSFSVATTEPGPTSTSNAVPRASAIVRCFSECSITSPLSSCIRQCRTRFSDHTELATDVKRKEDGASGPPTARVRCGQPRALAAPRPPARPPPRGRSRPPARRSSAGRARPARGRPPRSRRRVTASGLSGSPAAASTPSAITSDRAPPARAHEASSPTASSHGPSPEPGASGRLQVRALAAPRAALAGEAEEVGEPAGAGVDVDRAGEHRRVGVEDRLGAVAVVGVDVQHGDRAAELLAQAGGGERRVVQVARPAEGAPGDVMARRAAQRVG